MDKVLIPLIVVIAAGTSSVWSNSTRTPKLEILRSPTKVAVWKPDPYPVLRSYGDELPAPTVLNRTSSPTDLAEDAATTADPGTSMRTVDKSTASPDHTQLNNSTSGEPLDTSAPKTETCVRRDYEEDVAAVFRDEAGPIESAMLVFNSTVQDMEEKISNVTDLVNLRVLNETVVDCGAYLKLNETSDTMVNNHTRT